MSRSLLVFGSFFAICYLLFFSFPNSSFSEESLDELYLQVEELTIKKEFSEVLDISNKILKINPDDFNGLYYKARAYLGLEEYESSITIFEKILQENDIVTNKVLFNYGRALAGSERHELAIQYFNIFDESDPFYLDSLNLKGLSLIHVGNYIQAVDVFDQLLLLEENSLRALSNKATALSKLERYEEALDAVNESLEINSNYVVGIITKGNIFFHSGQYTNALILYDDALDLEPDNIDALNQKGLAFFHLQRYEESLSIFDKILVIDPNSTSALVNKAVVKMELEQYDEALILLDRALGIKRNNIDALNNIGGIYFKQGEYTQAIEFFDKVLEIDEKNVGTLNNKVLALGYSGNDEEAIKTADIILEIDPENEQAQLNREIASNNLAYKQSIELQTKIGIILVVGVFSFFGFVVIVYKRFREFSIKTSPRNYVLAIIISWMVIILLLVAFIDLRPDASAFSKDGDLANWATMLISLGIGVSITVSIFIYTSFSQVEIKKAVEEVSTITENIQTQQGEIGNLVTQVNTVTGNIQTQQGEIGNLVTQVADIINSQQQSEMNRKKNLVSRLELALPILKFGSHQRKNLVDQFNKNPSQRSDLQNSFELNENHPIQAIIIELQSIRNANLLSFDIETKIRNVCNESSKKPFLNSDGNYEYPSNVSHEKLTGLIDDLEKEIDKFRKTLD